MLTTPALLRLLLTTAAQSRDCARPGLGRFDRSHNVEVGADARTRLRFSPPKVPPESQAAGSAHGVQHTSPGIRSDPLSRRGAGSAAILKRNHASERSSPPFSFRLDGVRWTSKHFGDWLRFFWKRQFVFPPIARRFPAAAQLPCVHCCLPAVRP